MDDHWANNYSTPYFLMSPGDSFYYLMVFWIDLTSFIYKIVRITDFSFIFKLLIGPEKGE